MLPRPCLLFSTYSPSYTAPWAPPVYLPWPLRLPCSIWPSYVSPVQTSSTLLQLVAVGQWCVHSILCRASRDADSTQSGSDLGAAADCACVRAPADRSSTWPSTGPCASRMCCCWEAACCCHCVCAGHTWFGVLLLLLVLRRWWWWVRHLALRRGLHMFCTAQYVVLFGAVQLDRHGWPETTTPNCC